MSSSNCKRNIHFQLLLPHQLPSRPPSLCSTGTAIYATHHLKSDKAAQLTSLQKEGKENQMANFSVQISQLFSDAKKVARNNWFHIFSIF